MIWFINFQWFFSEPGFYKEGHFGIRLENVLEVVKKEPQVNIII